MSKKRKPVNQISFTIPRVPPSLNTMLRTHWTQRYHEQEAWDLYALAQWLARSKLIFINPVKILYILSFSSNRTRDLDNYIGGTKYITDALKKTFLMRDDASWLKGIEVQFVNGAKEETIVTITEV